MIKKEQDIYMTLIISEDEILKAVKSNRASDIIRDGGLVAFPTETVYGLGANALDKEAAIKIYKAKGRPSDNPLIVHIAKMSDIDRLVLEIPEKAQLLMNAFWPGPLTLVFKKSELIPNETTGGLDTVAIRMPACESALKLIEQAGVPIAAPSANLSGRPSPTSVEHVKEDMFGRIDCIIDGKESGLGIESTIIDVTEEMPCLLRPGYVTLQMAKEVIGDISVDPSLLEEGEMTIRPKAPGMKYRHYAPKGKMFLINGDSVATANYICDEIEKRLEKPQNDKQQVAILAFDENIKAYQPLNQTDNVTIMSLGSQGKASEIAHNLYGKLRDCDTIGASYIFCEALQTTGYASLAKSVMNRLMKAAGNQIINV